jgi:type VI secretion system protein ImpA
MDIEHLLRDVTADSPCGDDLEYDGAFLELRRAAQGRPPQEMGGQIIPGEEPDWRDVRDRALDLFDRTHDLRVAVTLAHALTRVGGLPGLADGLALVRGLLDRHWSNVHPRLDPEDGNDPTLRMNTLAGLADHEAAIVPLRLMPLADSRRLGRFGLRDVEIANGSLPRPEGAASAEPATIEAAFLDMDPAALAASGAAARAALEQLDGIESTLGAVVPGAGPDLSALRSTLRSIDRLLQQQAGRRGLEAAGADLPADDASPTASEGRTAMSGPIQSREDVIRVLDQVSDWYARHEPSSPVPLLLQRAKRLVNMSFMEAVKDLSPGGLNEIQTIAGIE